MQKLHSLFLKPEEKEFTKCKLFLEDIAQRARTEDFKMQSIFSEI